MELTLTKEQREQLDATVAVNREEELDDIYDFGAWLALDELEEANA